MLVESTSSLADAVKASRSFSKVSKVFLDKEWQAIGGPDTGDRRCYKELVLGIYSAFDAVASLLAFQVLLRTFLMATYGQRGASEVYRSRSTQVASPCFGCRSDLYSQVTDRTVTADTLLQLT